VSVGEQARTGRGGGATSGASGSRPPRARGGSLPQSQIPRAPRLTPPRRPHRRASGSGLGGSAAGGGARQRAEELRRLRGGGLGGRRRSFRGERRSFAAVGGPRRNSPAAGGPRRSSPARRHTRAPRRRSGPHKLKKAPSGSTSHGSRSELRRRRARAPLPQPAGPSSAAGGRELRCHNPRVQTPPVLVAGPIGASSAARTGSRRPRACRRRGRRIKGSTASGGCGGRERERGAALEGGARWDPRDGEAERLATCAERAGGDCERDSWATSMERLLDHRFFVFFLKFTDPYIFTDVVGVALNKDLYNECNLAVDP